MPADSGRCAWCSAALPVPRDSGWHVVGCAACGVGTIQPWPSPAELDAAYPDAYRPESGRFSGPGDRLLALTRGTTARRIDQVAPPGPVLDVGAGDGTLVRALQRRGREAFGVERDADPRHGLVDRPPARLDGAWSAIVLWHSLEHLPEPAEELAVAAARLAPGGVLIVAVPDWASLQARAFGRDWLALDLPRHLVHLPRRVVVERLGELGLRVERVSGWRGGQVLFGMLDGLVRRLPGRPGLYDAIRRPEARLGAPSGVSRGRTLVAGALLLPVALVAALVEISLGRSGTTYVEARRVG